MLPARCWSNECGSPNWDRPKGQWRKPGRPPSGKPPKRGTKRKARARAIKRAMDPAQPITVGRVSEPLKPLKRLKRRVSADALAFLDA